MFTLTPGSARDYRAPSKPKHPITYNGKLSVIGVVTPGISTKYTEEANPVSNNNRYIVLPRTTIQGGIATEGYEE